MAAKIKKNKLPHARNKKNKSKAQTRSLFGKPVRGRIDKNMPDFENDPVFVKRAEEAAAFLKKHPLPEEFLKKVKEKNKK